MTIVVPTSTEDAAQLRRDLEALHPDIQVDVDEYKPADHDIGTCDHCGLKDCPGALWVRWNTSAASGEPKAERRSYVGPRCAWRFLATEVQRYHEGPIYVQIVGWKR